MALPITEAQQQVCREAIEKWLAMTPGERSAVLRAQMEREAKLRDAVAIPCNKAAPHNP